MSLKIPYILQKKFDILMPHVSSFASNLDQNSCVLIFLQIYIVGLVQERHNSSVLH